MNILAVNPNTSDTVLEVILRSARRAASPGTEIVGLRSPGGTRNIDCAYGDYMSAPHVIEAVRRKVAADPPDAVVLCGFGNVGIFALKEILEVPVCSISESSMAMACLLGHRFSTLTMLEQFIPYQQDLVRLYGFEAKCASVRAIDVNVERAVIEREETLRQLTEQVDAVVREDGAEAVILACAGLCDYDRELTQSSGVPVIDPVVAGVKMAEAFVGMGVSHSKARKFHAPPQPLADYGGAALAPRPPAAIPVASLPRSKRVTLAAAAVKEGRLTKEAAAKPFKVHVRDLVIVLHTLDWTPGGRALWELFRGAEKPPRSAERAFSAGLDQLLVQKYGKLRAIPTDRARDRLVTELDRLGKAFLDAGSIAELRKVPGFPGDRKPFAKKIAEVKKAAKRAIAKECRVDEKEIMSELLPFAVTQIEALEGQIARLVTSSWG